MQICPIRSEATRVLPCLQNGCAWWDFSVGRCGVLSIATWLEGIAVNTVDVLDVASISQLDALPEFDIKYVETLNHWNASARLPGDSCKFEMLGPNEATARARLASALNRRRIELKNEEREKKE